MKRRKIFFSFYQARVTAYMQSSWLCILVAYAKLLNPTAKV